jgi:hypothetical protein
MPQSFWPFRRRWLLLVSLGLLVTVAAFPVRRVQHVEIVLRRGADIVPRQALKLVDARSAEACDAGGLQGETDEDGSFRGERWHRSEAIPLIGVDIIDDALCLREGDAWRHVWAGAYGPAPPTVRLACDLGQSGPVAGVCRPTAVQ